MKDHYSTLGVARDAPLEVIRAAYRVLAQKFHPDRNKDADAGVRAQEINVAGEVLLDPTKRADYDRGLPPLQVTSNESTYERSAAGRDSGYAFRSPAAPIRRGVGRTVYDLVFQDGTVYEHQEWTHYVQKIKNDGRLFVGIGKHLAVDGVAKQKLWLRFPCGDQLIERTGDTLPVATGHPITLVSIHQPGLSKPPVPFVLVNRASGHWYTLKNPTLVAAGLLTPWQSFTQLARFVAVFAVALALLYFTILRHVGILGWGFGLLFGVPMLFSIIGIYTQRETNRLEQDIRGGLGVAGMS